MPFLLTAIHKDLLRRRRDPWQILLWIGIPLIIGVLITLATGGGEGPKPVAKLLVADLDDTFVSGLVPGAFGQGPLAELVNVERVELDAGRARIDDGDGSALLVIPEGFGAAVLHEEPVTLQLVTNPAQTILPRIVEDALGILVDGAFYVQRVFGNEVRTITDLSEDADEEGTGPSDADVMRISIAVNHAMNRLGEYLFPPVISVEPLADEEPAEAAAAEAAGSIKVTFAVLFFPGVLFMSLLFTAQGLSDDLWREREQGTLRRFASTPRALTLLLAGKTVTAALIFLGVGLVVTAIGFAYHGVPMVRLPLAALWLTFSGTVLFTGMSVIQLHAPSRRAGALLTNMLVFPLMLAGGSFFPFEVMPDWLAAAGRWTPNGLMLEQLKQYMLGGPERSHLLPAFALLSVVGLLLFAIAAARHRSTFARA